jgi:hypothetical protein
MVCKMFRRTALLLAALLASVWVPRARADVGIVLNDSLDTSVARLTGSGHSAVYFSRICPASPIELRLCNPDEQGSVMSNYTSLGEDEPFEWNIAPLSVFAYGVTNSQDRPLFSSAKIKYALEQHYMETVLRDYCTAHSCQTSNKAEWHEMVSATSERTFYILLVSTTVEQDEALIAKFNDRANVNHFNGIARNCADFTKYVIDTYFPHAAHRDVLNDFGMTSPKAIARAFSRYAHRRPNDGYYVIHFAQLPGTIKRSSEPRNGTEQIFRAKRLALPVGYLAWPALPAAATSYYLTGYFSIEKEFEQHATVRESELTDQIKADEADEVNPSVDLRKEDAEQRDAVVGSPRDWAEYRESFDSIVNEAVRQGVVADRKSLEHVFKDLSEKGKLSIDASGALWLEFNENGKSSQVGISPATITAPSSDSRLAYQIILAHLDYALKSSSRRRETMPEFKEAWNLMEQIRAENRPSVAMAQ